MLDGVVDIYLPDFKFWDAEMSDRYMAGAENYPTLARHAITEMNRQVGVAQAGDDGVIRRGLMIRHLVMPNDAAGSEQLIDWIAGTLPKETCVNIMAQYSPAYKALDYATIARRVTDDEYRKVVERAQASGLTRLDIRGQRWLGGCHQRYDPASRVRRVSRTVRKTVSRVRFCAGKPSRKGASTDLGSRTRTTIRPPSTGSQSCDQQPALGSIT